MNRKQQMVIEYLLEENRVLKEQFDKTGKKLRLTNHQRRELALKGRSLGLQQLLEYAMKGNHMENKRLLGKLRWTDGLVATALIRGMVGLVFLSEGIQKWIQPEIRGAGPGALTQHFNPPSKP